MRCSEPGRAVLRYITEPPRPAGGERRAGAQRCLSAFPLSATFILFIAFVFAVELPLRFRRLLLFLLLHFPVFWPLVEGAEDGAGAPGAVLARRSCCERSRAGLNGEMCCRSSELWSWESLPEPMCDGRAVRVSGVPPPETIGLC